MLYCGRNLKRIFDLVSELSLNKLDICFGSVRVLKGGNDSELKRKVLSCVVVSSIVFSFTVSYA